VEGIGQVLADLDEFGPLEHACGMLAPGAEEQAVKPNEGMHDHNHIHPEDIHTNPDLAQHVDNTDRNTELHARYSPEANTTQMSPSEYRHMMQSLNLKQRHIITYHRQWCKDIVLALKYNKTQLPTYKLFINGRGGVGKSHLIKLIHYDTVRLLRLSGTFQPDDVITLL
jgi:chromosomal replication initiation ATPase DnaA